MSEFNGELIDKHISSADSSLQVGEQKNAIAHSLTAIAMLAREAYVDNFSSERVWGNG